VKAGRRHDVAAPTAIPYARLVDPRKAPDKEYEMRAPPRLRTTVFVICTCLTAAAAVRADEVRERRTISVTGEGNVTAAPDLAIVSFAVDTTATEASAAGEENARTSTAVAEAIKKRLSDKDKVTTAHYSLDPVYEQRERGGNQPPKITGYVARNEVRVETHAIDRVGELIDVATKAGSNRVSGLQFTLDDRSPYLRQALEKAGAEARQQAESVAKAIGVQLKQVVSATTSTSPIVPRRFQGFGMAAAESRTQTPVEAGEVTVNAVLQVTYEIE
jgi:uncharacterized protein YggE